MKALRIQKKLTDLKGDESGSMAVVVAILMVMLLSVGALAIDIGHIYWVQNDLKKAAEAGALAGARRLWPVDLKNDTNRVPNTGNATTCALNTATSNKVEGVNLSANEVTVQVGRYDYGSQLFNAGVSPANAVRVTTHRDNVKMFLAQIFGIFSKDMSANATAIMDFAASFSGSLPIAVNKKYITTGTPIHANPANNDNGGWFAAPPDGASCNTLVTYLTDPSHPVPLLSTGDIINFINGNVLPFLQALQTLVSNNGGTFDCVLPVVDMEALGTTQFNQSMPIDSFIWFRITNVTIHGNDKSIDGIIIPTQGLSSNALPGAGGGGTGPASPSTPLSPPKLVQCKN
jgi:Flp pilus assembly protein TadG